MGTYGNGKSKTKGGKQASEPPFRFINYDLSKGDKDWLRAADCEAEFSAEMVEDLVREGYKFSLSLDARNQSFVASLTDRAEGSSFKNSCLTGRGASPSAARHALLYRHFHLAGGDWSYFGSAAPDEVDDYA